MVGWHHRINEHKFEQTLGVGDGQGSLACCSPWGCKESDPTEQLSLHFTLALKQCVVKSENYVSIQTYTENSTDCSL